MRFWVRHLTTEMIWMSGDFCFGRLAEMKHYADGLVNTKIVNLNRELKLRIENVDCSPSFLIKKK